MNRKLSLITLATACILPLSVFAVDAAPTKATVVEKLPFTSSAELGFLYKTGNTKSADIDAGLSVKYEQGQWLSTLDSDILAK